MYFAVSWRRNKLIYFCLNVKFGLLFDCNNIGIEIIFYADDNALRVGECVFLAKIIFNMFKSSYNDDGIVV